jgi:hypothetical protein
MDAPHDSARLVTRLLSGYLCGTHSGLLRFSASGRRLSARAEAVSFVHRRLSLTAAGDELVLGERLWEPVEQGQLTQALRSALACPGVLDLVLFGSQARGERTGFSDVDAILVIAEEVADRPERLRALRSRVLAAQRAVLAYQPMQHHGFEVATPKLLRVGSEALALPSVALEETCSLNGAGTTAWLCDGAASGQASLAALVRTLTQLKTWPTHPWKTHGVVSMFELLPSLYLQSRGAPVPKWRSFGEARPDFRDNWWTYDELQDLRAAWPRLRMRRLERASSVVRNPWVALAAWRRVPERLPRPIRPLLTPRLLEGLQTLARTMMERAA